MKWIPLVVVLVILSACEIPLESNNGGLPDGATGLEPGQVSATVSGDVERTVGGDAVFEVLHGYGGSVFWIRLGESEGRGNALTYHLIDLTTGRETPPALGTYFIEEAPDGRRANFAGQYMGSGSEESMLQAQSGTVNIVSSDTAHVEGWFEFDATGRRYPDGGASEEVQVHITGKFNAVKGSVGVILN